MTSRPSGEENLFGLMLQKLLESPVVWSNRLAKWNRPVGSHRRLTPTLNCISESGSSINIGMRNDGCWAIAETCQELTNLPKN